MSYHPTGQALGSWVSVGAGTAAAGGCATLGAPMLAPMCGSIGAEIGGFLEQGLKSLFGGASSTEGTEWDQNVMNAASSARQDAYSEMARLLILTIKKFAVTAKMTEEQAAKALNKYVAFGTGLKWYDCTQGFGTTGNKPCPSDWWDDRGLAAGIARSSKYRPHPIAPSALVKIDNRKDCGRSCDWWGLDRSAFADGMSKYGKWTDELLWAVQAAAADIEIAKTKGEAAAAKAKAARDAAAAKARAARDAAAAALKAKQAREAGATKAKSTKTGLLLVVGAVAVAGGAAYLLRKR